MRSEEEAQPRAAVEEAEKSRPAVLPAPFIIAVVVLLVLLLVGLGLILLVGFLPA